MRTLRGAVTLALLGGAAFLVPAAAAASAPTCDVNFSVSNDHPAVGQDITLSWSSSGADELIASWTTVHVASEGDQVTTEQMPGPVSYQLTGLKSGQYCGGAVVNVVYAAVISSSTPAPPPTTSSAPTPTTSSAVSSVEPTTSASAPASSSANYPAQSPTGGSGTPWYEQPLNLLVIGVVSLFGSIALFNRERVRAALVRRH